MKVSTVGIDLAKNVFQLHGVNELGKTAFKQQLRRDQMAEFFFNLPACLIGIEACGHSGKTATGPVLTTQCGNLGLRQRTPKAAIRFKGKFRESAFVVRMN